jgi:hypothetical protein
MNKEFLPHEQSRALKELGFDEPCIGYYVGRDIEVFTSNNVIQPPYKPEMDSKIWFRAPLYQQAFRWFRDKQYFSEITIECDQHDGTIGYSWWIWKPMEIEEYSPDRKGFEWSYDTYEESELACLKKLIEIVKTK